VTVDWNLVVGILGLVVSTVVTVIVFQLGRRLDFRQRMQRRDLLREHANAVLRDAPGTQELREVLIVNAARYERDYDGGNRLTRHGWVQQRAEMLDVRHNGVALVSGVVQTWRTSDGRLTLRRGPRSGPNVLEVGFVPFDWVEHIDPAGDEYRYAPIFFVQFRGRGREPFAYRTYVEADGEPLRQGGRTYRLPIDDLGRSRPSWLGGHRRFIREWRQARRMDRAARKHRSPL
jgi:hypothetical protein